MQQGEHRFRFWVHDYAPLPASSAIQVIVVIGMITGLLLALPFTTSLSDLDLWTIGLVVVCVPVIAVAVFFLRRARFVTPARRMVVVGFVAGFVVGFGGQLLFAPG